MKVRELVERLMKLDQELEVEVGTREDSEEIIAVYYVNLYQGKGLPYKPVICIDIVKDEE